VSGMRNVTVRVWDAATGGAAVCTTMAPGTPFSAGRFRVALDAACAGAVRANPNLWAEVQVDATTFPRSKLGAVPYALEAGRAAGASGPLETRIAALEGRDGGVGGGGSRQVEVGTLGARQTVMCLNSFQISSALAPLNVVAATTGVYRVSAVVFASTCSNGILPFTLRIGASTSTTFLSQPNVRTWRPGTCASGLTGGQYEGTVWALVRLEAGQSYAFNLEVRVAPDPSSFSMCQSDMYGIVEGLGPLVLERIN
jgi:hypothetical protein